MNGTQWSTVHFESLTYQHTHTQNFVSCWDFGLQVGARRSLEGRKIYTAMCGITELRCPVERQTVCQSRSDVRSVCFTSSLTLSTAHERAEMTRIRTINPKQCWMRLAYLNLARGSKAHLKQMKCTPARFTRQAVGHFTSKVGMKKKKPRSPFSRMQSRLCGCRNRKSENSPRTTFPVTEKYHILSYLFRFLPHKLPEQRSRLIVSGKKAAPLEHSFLWLVSWWILIIQKDAVNDV